MDRRELLLGAAAATLPATEPLRVTLPMTWGPPFVHWMGEAPPTGLLPDMIQALGRDLGLPIEWVRLPALRAAAAMQAGEVDLQCPMHPDWWGQPVAAHRWSAPLLTLRDVLVAAPDGPSSWEALRSNFEFTRVGTVHGYLYPSLSAEFASGRFKREDAPHQMAVLGMLARSRLPVGVVNEYVLHAFNKTRPRHDALRAIRVISEVEAGCLLSAHPRPGAARLHRAIERLGRSAQWRAVLDSYGATLR